MTEINYAERERQVRDEPTEESCYRMGQTHFAYGWARTPWGHWSDEHKAHYYRGYDDAKAAK